MVTATPPADLGIHVTGRIFGLHTSHWQQVEKGCRCGSALVYEPRPDGMAADGELRQVCLDCGRRTIHRTVTRVTHEGPCPEAAGWR
jgi:hypothetical protein